MTGFAAPTAIDIAISVSRLVHNECKDVPHDIGLKVINLILEQFHFHMSSGGKPDEPVYTRQDVMAFVSIGMAVGKKRPADAAAVHVFGVKRPVDSEPWFTVFKDRERAEAYPNRCTEVTTVSLSPLQPKPAEPELPAGWVACAHHGDYIEATRLNERAVFHVHVLGRPPTVHYCTWIGRDVQCDACGNGMRLPEQSV